MRKDGKYRFTLQFGADSEDQIRVGELLALTPEDIDFDRHIISVNKNYQ